ncbi:MAG: hypothetical protein AAGD07_05820 [Planctomycetota bacterium]
MTVWIQRLAILCAGLVWGGSLIVAPAKFQVEALTMPVALQVGRAQFLWVSIAEASVMVTIAILMAFAWKRGRVFGAPPWLLLLAVVLFATQHLLLMPPLQARSERIIAGASVADSQLHLVYVVAECVKVFALLLAGTLSMRQGVSADRSEP